MKKYPLLKPSATKNASRDINLAFDVGHSSIGWAVLQSCSEQSSSPMILGCGVVTFKADDCLASQRRDFRRQRRHIRSTRKRIERMEKFLQHLGVLSKEELAAKHKAGGGHSAAWLLAAQALRDKRVLSWPELWDVLRWYAHNRGYDGNRCWSNNEGQEGEDTAKEEAAKMLMIQHRTQTMAETFCKELDINPDKTEKMSSQKRFKGLNAAFPRAVVEREVETILKKHEGKLNELNAQVTKTLMKNGRELRCPGYKLARRFEGGLLFGQSVPRFDNRIITICPVSGGKACAKTAPEFLLFRWLMQLANVRVDRANPALTKTERHFIHAKMCVTGSLTPSEFKKAVSEATGDRPNNLAAMLMHPDSAKALVLDPLNRLIHSERVQFLWPHLPERIQKRAKGKWRKGKTLTLRKILAWCDETGTDSNVILQNAQSAVAAKAGGKTTKDKKEKSHDLDALITPERLGGRAPYARDILRLAATEILEGHDPRRKRRGNDPESGEEKPKDGILVTTDLMTEMAQKRSLDDLTNNHLVRHRLLILQRLVNDIVADPAFCQGNPSRVGSVAIEVNSDLKDFSGKTAKQIAQEVGQQLGNFKAVVRKLEDAGFSNPSPNLIRKARVADDLRWTCPYTGRTFDAQDLVHPEKWDKDHIIPYSERPSNSLDSLVITSKGLNMAKKNRTALQFVEELNEPQNQVERERLGVWTTKQYRDFVDSLEAWKGHATDIRRKRRRKQLLLLPRWEDREFLPRDLTITAHLTRLGAVALRRCLPHLKAHEITSLPGSVTGTIRTGWKLLGCLSAGNAGVLEPDGGVKTKTEIREVTHLHHALDAIVIGLSHHYFQKNGRLWEAIVSREKQRSETDNLLLLKTGLYHRTPNGVLFAKEPPKELANNIRARLAECRVVQHVPADMGGVRAEQNTWRVLGVENGSAKLRQQMRGADGKKKAPKIALERSSKILGLKIGKLSALKGALVISENYGLALDPEPAVIPWHKVWHRLAELKKKNGGKMPRVLRTGMMLRITDPHPNGKHVCRDGIWRISSVQASLKLDLIRPDIVGQPKKGPVWREVRIQTLSSLSFEILNPSLCGVS